nr:hypothetical protein [Tanacetum cinerariifolium]
MFQPLFDELLTPPPSVDLPARVVIALIAELVVPELAASTDSPFLIIVDQDAPSPSNSQNSSKTQSIVIYNDVKEENHDLDVAHMNNNLFFGISISKNVFEASSSLDIIPTVVHTAAPNSEHISQSPRGIFLNQLKYALKSLKKYGMESSDPVDTPMVKKSKLDEDPKGKAVDPTHYCVMVGTLMYLTASRLDLTFVEPLIVDSDIQRILIALKAYADADHAGFQDTRRSTSGSMQSLGDRLVSWSSKRQKSAAISSTEPEYIPLSGCCAQVLWMRSQLTDYGLGFNKIPIFHFIKEKVENEVVELYFVNTEYQLADTFAKALCRERIEFLINKLRMRSFMLETLQQLADEAENSGDMKPKEATFQVALDALALISFYQAFFITAEVPAIYMQEFWATIYPKVLGQRFKEPPLEHDILSFLREIEHSGDIHCMTDSIAYQTYYAYAIGEKAPKEKYVRKKAESDTSPTKKIAPASKGSRLKSLAKVAKTDKKKQHAKIPKTKGLDVLTEVMELTLSQRFLMSNNKSEETESDNDGDDLTHPNLSTYKANDEEEEEEKADDDEEVSSNQRVSTPPEYELTKEEENKEGEDEDMEGEQEQDEEDDMYRDVNINLERSDAEMTNAQANQDMEDTHVTLTTMPPVVQHQSSYISSDLVSKFINHSLDIESRDNQDKDEDPSARSNRGLKRKRTGKEAESSNEPTHKESKPTSSSKGTSRSQLKSSDKSTYAKEHGQKVNDLEDQTHQEFNTGNDDVTPVREALDDDESQRNPSSSPTPDREWHKTKTVNKQPPQLWITQMAQASPLKVFYGKHAYWGTYHWGPKLTSLKIVKYFGYSHPKEIIIRRQDDQLYKFREGDFKRLRRQDIKDMLLFLVQNKLTNLNLEEQNALNVALRMFARWIVVQERVEYLQLGVESYQKKINLTRPDTYRSDLQRMTPYTAYPDIQGIIYEDEMNKNRLMRTDELHKFSDGTFNHVRTALNDIATGIEMDYLP